MQATAAQLARYNELRCAKGYTPVHPDDWPGVSSAQAQRLIRHFESARPARRP